MAMHAADGRGRIWRRTPGGRGSARAFGVPAITIAACAACAACVAMAAGLPSLGQPVNPLQLLQSARPQRDGQANVPGLGAPVVIARDGIGVPDIQAEGDLADAQRALGFLHAQERFFQMHLARSYASGRVATFAGPSLRATDERMRRLGLAEVADELVARFDPETRHLVDAYVAGVNAGLVALGDPPIELQQAGLTLESLERWRSRDTVLVLLFMWEFLSSDAGDEPWRAVLADAASPEVFDYLTTPWHRDDVMVDGRRDPAPAPSLPGPEALTAAAGPPAAGPTMFALGHDRDDREDAAGVPGSNGWAVAGSRTVHGRAILASDPHLMLAAPGVWYRATMRWDGGAAHGVTLPGSPGILIGSNERVAWGFTNTTGDFQDLVVIEPDPQDPARYLVPGGTEAFVERSERIQVLGEAAAELTVRDTRWGPIVGEDHRGRPVALRWTGLDADRMNFNVLRLMTAANVDEALDIAASWYGPSQNAVIAGADGRVGWTLTGFLPDRFGFDGRTPVSWADGTVGWRAGGAPRPRVADPEGGRIITANSRTLPLAEARRIGHGWANPSRAARIAERLEAMPLVDERAMLDLQLDDQVHGFLAWRDLVVAAYAEASAPLADPDVAAVVAALASWDGRATLDSRVLSVLGRLRGGLGDRALERLLASVPAVAGRVRRSLPWDEPARRILQEQPVHLIPEGFDDWNAVIRATVAEVVRDEGRGPVLVDWRETNIARVRHPLSPVVPELATILDMPPVPIPGHWWAVRVHSDTFGVSTRIVVAPGLEAEAFCHIPAGQSGHPGERDYRSSHADWVRGTPTPLLSGAPVATLRLVPAG